MPMDELIYTYALNKYFLIHGAEGSVDYLTSFSPFILESLKMKDNATNSILQKYIKEEYGFEIPLHVLDSILTKLENEKLVYRTSTKIETEEKVEEYTMQYKLSQTGIEFKSNFDDHTDIKKEIDTFLDGLKRYFKDKHNIDLGTNGDIVNLLKAFIYINFDSKISFEELENKFKFDIRKDTNLLNLLYEYIVSLKETNANGYNTFNNLLRGYIIYLTIGSFPERNKRYNDIILFLDTNMVFLVLGFHYPEFTKPAAELFKLIKDSGFDLRIFDFTLEEAKNKLNRCGQEDIVRNVKIDSICAYLFFQKGKTLDEIKYLSSNLEAELQKHDILIRKTGLNLNSYFPSDKTLINDIKLFKPEQGRIYRLHDLAALEKIRDIRNRKTYIQFEQAKAFFLTSDRRLTKFNYEIHHKKDYTIPEVILDRSLTNILWLSNPSIELNIENLIASCCRGLFINRQVWEEFYRIFKDLQREGRLNDNDYATLIYHDYLEKALCGYGPKNLMDINENFVRNILQQVKDNIREESDIRIYSISNIVISFVQKFLVSLTLIIAVVMVIFAILFSYEKIFYYLILIIILILIFSGCGPSKRIWETLTKKTAKKFGAQ